MSDFYSYIVNGGVNGVNFFLPVKEAEKYSSNLTIGEPLECSIREINLGARTVTLRVNRNGHKEEVVKSSQIPFIALAPGMLFDVIVNKKVDNGYIVNYLNLFNGMVDLNSMAIPSSTQEWKDAKEPTSAIKARIVFIDYNNKIVRLSLKRHILEFRSPAGLPELGAVVENLVVVSSNKRSGAISRIQVDQESIDEMKQLQSEISEIDSTTDNKEKTKTLNELKGKLQNTLTFQLTKKSLAASIDQSNEEEVDAIDENKIASVYETGTTIPSVKVLGYHLLENIVIASNLKSVLDSTVSHHKDIKVGQSHTVEITAVRDFGLVCSISNKISAVCPTSHTGDVVIDTKLKKRFKVGQKLKMRVWEASADGAIILTNKKSLVELPDQSVLSSYETSQVDGHYVGVIGKITTNGLTVRFFNNIHGDVPAVILSQQGVLDLEESYRAGQIIKLVLLKVESKSQGKNGKQFKKLIFALDLNITESVRKQLTALLENKTEGDGNKSGSIIGGAVMKVEDNELIVRLDDGKLAKLPKAHVFDSASTAEAVFASKDHPFKAGYRIEKALILSGNDKEVFITTKPLLLFAAQQRAEDISIPSGVSGLSPGQMLAGYIAKVENYGVVVRFRNGFTALAPRPSLADKFVNTPIGLFNVGDAIRCVVQRVDLGKERAIVTFKPSMIPPLPSGHHFINSYWQELFLTSSHKAAADKKLFPNWKEYKIGQVYQAKLSSVESYGAVFLADDQTTIFVDRAFTGKLKAGESTKLLILDLDIVNCVFEVKVVDKSLQKSLKSQNNIANGETVDVVIETIKDKYLVVSKGVFIGFVPLADYNNLTPEVVDYKVGATLKVQSLGQQSQTGNEYPHGLVNICVVPQDTTAVRSRLVKLQKEAADSDEKLHKRLAGDNESTADATVVRQKFIESLRVGAAMKWTVESKTATELKLLPEFNELMGLKVQAFVHISACSNDFIANDNLKEVLSSSNIKKKDRERVHASHPFHNIKDKQSVWCHVLQVRRETDDKDNEVFIVYLRLSDKKQNNDTATSAKFHPMLQAHGKDELKVATVAPVYVTRINQATCTVALSPYITAELPIIEISKDRALIDLFHQKCFCGLRLLVAVTAVTKEDGKTTKVHVSRASIESLIEAHGTEEIDDIQDKVNEIESEVNYEEGDIVVGTVNLFQSKVPKPPAFVVSLRGNKFGRLCVSEITERENWRDSSAALQSDDATRTLFNGLAHGSIVTCRIVSTKDKMIELSLRKSRVVSTNN